MPFEINSSLTFIMCQIFNYDIDVAIKFEFYNI